MLWLPSTDNALNVIREAIGDTLTIDATTFTWTRQIEGDPWHILEEISDYPYIIHRIGDSSVDKDPSILPISFDDTISVIVESTSVAPLADSRYKGIRTLGERVISNIMTAGPRLGTNWLQRRLLKFGVDYDLTNDLVELGVMVYNIQISIWYGEYEVRA